MSIFRRLTNLLRNAAWLVRPSGLRHRLDLIDSALTEKWNSISQRLNTIEPQIDFVHKHSRSWADVMGHRMLLNPHDSIVSAQLCLTGSFEPFETEVILRHIREGDTVLDLGANIGYYTLHFARLVGPRGRVIAFEPDPTNFDILWRNVLANGYRNVTLIRKAVADVTKMVRLYLAPENKGDHRIYDPQDKRDSIAIEAIALDDYFAGEHPRVDFIKMDIQGAEAAALRGMKRVLDCNPEAVLATEFWPTGMRQQGADPWRFVEQLREHGFSLTVVDERGRRLEPTDHARLAAELASPDCRFTNLLCVPFGRDADVRAA